MPIPRPRSGEPERDYLERGHEALASEYPDEAQRSAILYRTLRGVRKSSLEDAILEGTRVEMEHTPNELTAARIALDHLMEDPDYYAKLRAVEKGLTGSGDPCYNGSEGDTMDASLRKALDGTKALVRVAKAAMPEGTVSHRKDGDWKKTGGQWVRLPPSDRQGQSTPAGKPAPAGSQGKEMSPAEYVKSMRQKYGYDGRQERMLMDMLDGFTESDRKYLVDDVTDRLSGDLGDRTEDFRDWLSKKKPGEQVRIDAGKPEKVLAAFQAETSANRG